MEDRRVPRLVIAGTHSGVGKTTVTLALLAAFVARGHRVQAFKAGPDFIDPGHHRAITGRPSRNLDGWMLGAELNRAIFGRAAADADLAVIEGMMGLFDGSSPVEERGSTAELAKQVMAPVLLVVDGSAMARSAAAMVQGYVRFDPEVRVAGVVFNRLSGEGHYRLLKEAVEAATNVPVLGYLRADAACSIPDRHLGLTTAIEGRFQDQYRHLGEAAASTIELDRVEALAQSAIPLTHRPAQGDPDFGELSQAEETRRVTLPSPPIMMVERTEVRGRPVRIGIAWDEAFCFYYPENLELLEAYGAELVRFSPMRDQALPPVDLVYFGGGYPEVHAGVLAANEAMRQNVRELAERGGPIYAECGGLMYLTEAIRDFDGHRHPMVGLFPAETVMRRPGLTLGYRTVHLTRPCLLGEPGVTVRGHEFHYSRLETAHGLEYAVRMADARNQDRGPDGLIYWNVSGNASGNVLALYTHLHFASRPEAAAALVEAARQYRQCRANAAQAVDGSSDGGRRS